MARLPDLPVFPLPLVLLPGELLPLHIFEPRYREPSRAAWQGPSHSASCSRTTPACVRPGASRAI